MKKSSFVLLASIACFSGGAEALFGTDYYVTQATDSGSPVNCPDSTYSSCATPGNGCCTLSDAITLSNSDPGSTIHIGVPTITYTGAVTSPCTVDNVTTIQSDVGGSVIVFNGSTSTCTTDFGSATVFQPTGTLALTDVAFQDSNTGSNVININNATVNISNSAGSVFSNNTWTVEGSNAILNIGNTSSFPDDIFFATNNANLSTGTGSVTLSGNITQATGLTGVEMIITAGTYSFTGNLNISLVRVANASAIELSGDCSGTTFSLSSPDTYLYVNSSDLGTPTIVSAQSQILFGGDVTLGGIISTPNLGTIIHPSVFDDQGHTVQIDALMAGSSSRLTKTGSGIIILTNNNNQGNNYYIQQGTLSISNVLQLGPGGGETLAGGTLFASSSLTLSNSFALAVESSGNLAAAAGQTLTIDLPMSGSGSLTIGSSVAALSATGTVGFQGLNSTFTGPIIIGDTTYASKLSLNSSTGIGTPSAFTLNAASTFASSADFTTTSNWSIAPVGTRISPSSGTTLTLAGNLSPITGSTYEVMVSGGGTLVLSGTNNGYTANIIINDSSTVSVANSANLGDSSTSTIVLNAGTLAVTQSGNVTQNIVLGSDGGVKSVSAGAVVIYDASSFSGPGTLTKSGTGTLILTGTGSYTGKTYVQDGALIVEGIITSSVDPIVNPGGILAGTGTVSDSIIYGTIKGGNPVGTLSVVGDLDFQSGGSLGTIVTPTDASLVDVTGPITIDPHSVVLVGLTSTSYSSSPILILRGTSITGEFDTTFNNYTFSTLSYTDTEVFLNLNSVINLARGGNAIQVANAVDAAIANNRLAVTDILLSGHVDLADVKDVFEIPEVIASLAPFDTSETMTYALNQLHPAEMKGMAIAQENNAVRVRQALSQRMQIEVDMQDCLSSERQDSQGKPCCNKPKQDYTAWVGGLGNTLVQDTVNNYWGPLTGYRVNTGGAVAGIDRMFVENIYVGIMGGYTNSNLHFRNDKGTGSISTGYAGLYFSAVGTGDVGKMFYGNLSVIGGWSQYRAERHIQYTGVNLVAKNHHGGNQLLSHADTGINLDYLGFTIRPFDSFDYVAQTERGYQEHNAGAWELTVSRKNEIMLRNELGLQFAKCLCFCSSKWIFSPKISWVREVRVKGDTITMHFTDATDTFFSEGYFPDRSLVAPGLAVTGLMLEDSLKFDLYYNGEFKGNYSSNNVGGQVTYSF